MIDDRNGSDRDMPEDDVAAQAASARQYDWRPRPDPTVLTTQQSQALEVNLRAVIREAVAGLRELMEQRLDGMDQATGVLTSRIDGIIPDSLHGRDVLRAEFAAADQSNRELISERIDGMDKANEILAANVSKFPSDVDRAVGALKAVLMAEIQRNREVQGSETKRIEDVNQEKFNAIDGTFASNALALTAALAAQKEAAAEQNKSNTLAIDRANSATKETIAANAAQTANSLSSQAATIGDLKERVVRIESTGAGATASKTETRLSQGAVVSLAVAILAVLGVVVSIVALVHHP